MDSKKKDKKGRNLEKGERQLPDGRYQYRYSDFNDEYQAYYSYKLVDTDKTPKGKKDKISIRAFKLKIAIAKNDGISYKRKAPTLNEVFDKYVNHQFDSGQIQACTFHNYMGAWKHVRKSKISNKKIKDLRKSHFEILAKELFDDFRVGDGTINLIKKKLKNVMEFACDEDYIKKDYARGALKAFDVTLKGKDALTLEEQTNFVKFIKENEKFNYFSNVVVFILETAVRISEMAGLTIHDIDLADGIININKQYLRKYISKDSGKGEMRICPPKTPSSYRQIPLSAEAARILELQINSLKSTGLIDNYDVDSYIDGEVCKNFVFLTPRRTLWQTANFDKHLGEAIKAYNKQEAMNAADGKRNPKYLPNFSAHVLRHTACTRLSEKKICPTVLQALMGHKNLNTTNIYNHVDKKRLKSEMQRLER